MDSLFSAAIEIIRSSRTISLPYWGLVETTRKKSDFGVDVVTEVDFQIESYLQKELTKLDSSVKFVGEECGGDRNASRYWLIDPIDGTAHFARGLPFCTTMVALVENREVTFSAIYDFVNDVLYSAVRGKGAYKNNELIRVSDRPATNAYMFFEINLSKPNNLSVYLNLKKSVKLLNTISSGYDYALIASGKIEGRLCFDPFGFDYDYAPGSLLVSEAGGVVANIGSTEYRHTNLNWIAANRPIYETLTKGSHALFPERSLDG
jgi:myo-inositol-1(or 4)-monophosphatase